MYEKGQQWKQVLWAASACWMSTTECSTCRRTGVTVCTAAVWVNVATTLASQIPARMVLHARSRRLRCSTASAAKGSGVRCQHKEASILVLSSPAVFLVVILGFLDNHGILKGLFQYVYREISRKLFICNFQTCLTHCS